MRKVLYVSGTRADYGLMRSTLRAIEARTDLELVIVATGMHLMPEFGRTVEQIENDGFRVIIAPATIASDEKSSTPIFLGELTVQLTNIVTREAPDEILLLGDRAEMLAGAIVGTYMGIPTFHVHGGDISSTVDEHVRHAITKLSHFHLAATESSAERLRRMGEEMWRVFTVGSPSLDDVLTLTPISDLELRKNDLQPREYLMLVQHPVSEEADIAGEQISGTIDALIADGRRTVVVYPNADAGGRRMIEVIEERCRSPQFVCFKSMPRDDYLRLMARAAALIGNSSGGLVETPSFGTPFINVGDRQKGRERGDNVIDVGYGKEEVLKGLKRAENHDLLHKVGRRRNPYGDGCTGKCIAEILAELELSDDMTQKCLAYDL
ncbi:MAG TPA: UDP-N-acetylglucosamine 2-epimerase [Methanomassiliicoccales archaeon]|nr:UDP-N-acetylglucosamine 2-epimerase [Methanomassiliicoccales archaeon]